MKECDHKYSISSSISYADITTNNEIICTRCHKTFNAQQIIDENQRLSGILKKAHRLSIESYISNIVLATEREQDRVFEEQAKRSMVEQLAEQICKHIGIGHRKNPQREATKYFLNLLILDYKVICEPERKPRLYEFPWGLE